MGRNLAEEKELFDSFKEDWWNPKGRLAALHRITPIRFEYFKSLAGELKGKSLLDIGCGGGLLSECFAKSGADVTGIDLSPLAIEAATEHSKKSGLKINYLNTSPKEFLEENGELKNSFDIVLSSEVLEHVDDLPGFLKDSVELIKPDGLYFFSTINKTLMARFLAIFIAEDILRMVSPGTHEYERFIKPSLLRKYLEELGVTIEGLKGMTFDPLRLKFKLSKNTSVNYLGYGRKG